VVPFESYGIVSYSPFIVTMAVSLAISEIVQGHWKWRGSTDHVWLSISPPL